MRAAVIPIRMIPLKASSAPRSREGFVAGRGPAHGTADRTRGQQNKRLLRVGENPRPEAAAHIGREDTQCLLGDAERSSQDAANEVRAVGIGNEGEFVVGAVAISDRRSWLDGIDDNAGIRSSSSTR